MKLNIIIAFLCFSVALSAQLNKKDLNKILKSTTEQIEKDSKNTEALYLRSMVYYEMEDFDNAIPDLKEVIRLDPDLLQAYVNLADIYSLRHEFKKAGKYYDLAIKNGYELDIRMTYVIGSNFYFNKEYDLAIKYLLMVIDKDKNPESGAYNNLAWAYLYTDQIDLSVEYFKKAYEVNPNFVNNVNNLGYAYYMLGELETAEEYILKAKKMDSKNAFVYRNLGLIYKKRDNKSKACGLLKKAVSLDIIDEWGIDYVQELIDYCDN